MTRQTPFVKEFKDVAFSLQEGGVHVVVPERIRDFVQNNDGVDP